ncbi:Fe-S protein [Pseudomonas syringae]|uniref:Fe-S protein n=1 Tax=Pseudomonas syringae TaxID=317 RepID=A0A1C7Z1E0_PSESX|nr:DUF1289 domain-containing protein [Pseudomonas syringae]OCR23239.1 Fe-S protein [Pseudomonas syringae]
MQAERRVPSPCVSICALDDDDVCLGCQRTVKEITDWHALDNEQRRAVLVLCHERAEASGLVWSVPSPS